MSLNKENDTKWSNLNQYKRKMRTIRKHLADNRKSINLQSLNLDLEYKIPSSRKRKRSGNGAISANAAANDNGATTSNGICDGNGNDDANEESRAAKRLQINEKYSRKDSISSTFNYTISTSVQHEETIDIEKNTTIVHQHRRDDIAEDHNNDTNDVNLTIDCSFHENETTTSSRNYEKCNNSGHGTSDISDDETSYMNVERDTNDIDDDRDEDDDDDVQDDEDDEDDEDGDDDDENEENVETEDNEGNDNLNKTFSIKNKIRDLSATIHFSSRITNLFVLLTMLAAAIRSKLTYTAIIIIFKALKKTIVDSVLPSTKHSLWKLLSRNDEATITRYWYCRKCQSNIGIGRTITSVCRCQRCGPRKKRNYTAYFIQLNIKSQLIQLLENPVIAKSLLTYRYTRKKRNRNSDNMEDIYDSEKYKKLCERSGFLENQYNYSLSLFTDGIKVSNSSNASAWPIMLMINELPPHLRKKYMILAAIYVDDKHPNLQSLLLPTVDELNSLYKHGLVWANPRNENVATLSKFITIICTADSKARAPLLNMTQGNGIYGCTYCYHKGLRLEQRGVVRVYPYQRKPSRRRTDADIRRHMKLAHNRKGKKRIFGVEDFATIALLDKFDLSSGLPVDSMHNVYLGVVKAHTDLLVHKIKKKKIGPWFVGTPKNLTTIDKRLMKIRPPSVISRKPRSIRDSAQWKASEWRNWIQFYAVHCLSGLVDEIISDHLALLSRAAFILNKDSISNDELESARTMLRNYVQQYNEIFKNDNMTINVHLLNHLADSVKENGPFWTHSAFPYESFNKIIIDKVTSANSRCLQIATRHLLTRFIENTLCDPSIPYGTREAVNDILTGSKKYQRRAIDEIAERAKVLECQKLVHQRAPTIQEARALSIAGYTHPPCGSLSIYRTALVNGNIRCSSELSTKSKMTRYSNKYIHCDTVGYAEIKQIIAFRNNKDSVVSGFIIEKLEAVKNYKNMEHIQCVSRGEEAFIACDEISTIVPAILITTLKKRLVLSKIPNIWETD